MASGPGQFTPGQFTYGMDRGDWGLAYNLSFFLSILPILPLFTGEQISNKIYSSGTNKYFIHGGVKRGKNVREGGEFRRLQRRYYFKIFQYT